MEQTELGVAFFIYRNVWGYASNTADFIVTSFFDTYIQIPCNS